MLYIRWIWIWIAITLLLQQTKQAKSVRFTENTYYDIENRHGARKWVNDDADYEEDSDESEESEDEPVEDMPFPRRKSENTWPSKNGLCILTSSNATMHEIPPAVPEVMQQCSVSMKRSFNSQCIFTLVIKK